MFEWDDGRFALAVHRAGSLSGAAGRLHADQSTVGRRVSALERALGVRLFERGRDGMTATPAGEALVESLERMESEAHGLVRAVTGRDAKVAGSVRVTAPELLGSHYLAPRLAVLPRRHPELEIELVADNRALSLTRREADLAVRLIRPSQSSLVMRSLGEVGSGFYASRSYLRERGTPRARGLKGHDVIGYDDTFQPTAEVDWLLRHASEARVAMRCNSASACLAAARAGGGLALVPCYAADADSELVQVVPPQRAIRRPLWLVLHRDLRSTGRVRAVVDFLTDQISRDAAMLRG